jgi:hypothetical protein
VRAGDGLAHLERHRARVLGLLAAQELGRLAQAVGAGGEGRGAPLREGAVGGSHDPPMSAGVASGNVSMTSPVAGLIDWMLMPLSVCRAPPRA